MTTTETVAGPPDAGAAEVPRDLRRELIIGLRACTPKMRKWLLALPKNNFATYGTGEKLGLSSRTVFKYLHDERVKRVRAIQDEIAADELNLTTSKLLSEYMRIAFADLRTLFDEHGNLKAPELWPDEIAAAVDGFDIQSRRLKHPTSGEWLDEYELTKKVRTHSKLNALEFLAKFKNLAGAQRIELTGADGLPLQNVAPIIQFVRRGDKN